MSDAFLHLFSMSWCFLVFFLCSCLVEFLLCFSLWPMYLHPFARVSRQAWDWLWYPLTCGPRGRVGVCIEQNFRSKYLPRPGFEPRTSRLAVQQATSDKMLAISNMNVTDSGR